MRPKAYQTFVVSYLCVLCSRALARPSALKCPGAWSRPFLCKRLVRVATLPGLLEVAAGLKFDGRLSVAEGNESEFLRYAIDGKAETYRPWSHLGCENASMAVLLGETAAPESELAAWVPEDHHVESIAVRKVWDSSATTFQLLLLDYRHELTS